MHGLVLEAAESLKDLDADGGPRGDVASLRFRVERDVVLQDVETESGTRRGGGISDGTTQRGGQRAG